MKYRVYTGKMEVDKALNNLKGILEGIQADQKVKAVELDELIYWVKEHSEIVSKKPFDELKDLINEVTKQNFETPESLDDLKWLVHSLSENYISFGGITSELQTLHGYCHGLLADGILQDNEIYALKEWMEYHQHLKGYYPYDEVYSSLIDILEDGVVSMSERKFLMALLNEFCDLKNPINQQRVNEETKDVRIGVIFDKLNSIVISDQTFVFTGNAARWRTKDDFKKFVEERGGFYSKNVSGKIDCLVIGTDGNPCWAYSKYGRKVEDAIKWRKKGKSIKILSEEDFWNLTYD